MIKGINLNKVFIIDIETVPQFEHFSEMSVEAQQLWDKKTKFLRVTDQTAAQFYERAGIWAEFGKIVCISIGFFYNYLGKQHFKVTSYFGDIELDILLGFGQLINEQALDIQLCAHNGKEFDFPYLCRRMLINQLEIPPQLQIAGKRPWEINHLDTLELWKFGDYKNYTSLNLLAHVLNLPSPKDEIDGSMVKDLFYKNRELLRIVNYCQKDVSTTAQILLRLLGLKVIPEENIILVTPCLK